MITDSQTSTNAFCTGPGTLDRMGCNQSEPLKGKSPSMEEASAKPRDENKNLMHWNGSSPKILGMNSRTSNFRKRDLRSTPRNQKMGLWTGCGAIRANPWKKNIQAWRKALPSQGTRIRTSCLGMVPRLKSSAWIQEHKTSTKDICVQLLGVQKMHTTTHGAQHQASLT